MYIRETELFHSGVKGMKWGVRRFQNEDGSLTEAGRKRYSKYQKALEKVQARGFSSRNKKRMMKLISKRDKYGGNNENSNNERSSKLSSIKWSGEHFYAHPSTTDQQRQAFERQYKQKRKALLKKFKSASTEQEKNKWMKKADDLERNYLDVVERDW